MKKGGLNPRKPWKMPGLPNGAFLKNPVKRPDSIRVVIVKKTANGAHSGDFRNWVNFPYGYSGDANAADRKKSAAKVQ
jgi:hypothetical protein